MVLLYWEETHDEEVISSNPACDTRWIFFTVSAIGSILYIRLKRSEWQKIDQPIENSNRKLRWKLYDWYSKIFSLPIL